MNLHEYQGKSILSQFGVRVQRGLVAYGEPFWGNDRQPQIERWLSSGPF